MMPVITATRLASVSEVVAEMDRRGQVIEALEAALAAATARAERAEAMLREAGWQPIATAPIRTSVDLWCVDYDPGVSAWEGGAPVGYLEPNRFKTVEYGWFGNQSPDGIPRAFRSDAIPVAWKPHVACPVPIIDEFLTGYRARLTVPSAPTEGGADE